MLSAIGDARLRDGDILRAEAAFGESVRMLHRSGAHQRLPWPIAGLAALSADQGQTVRAVTLWAAVRALRATTASADHRLVLEMWRSRVEAASAKLPVSARAAAEKAGGDMNVDAAVAFALSD